jgi:lipase chaperone LimK
MLLNFAQICKVHAISEKKKKKLERLTQSYPSMQDKIRAQHVWFCQHMLNKGTCQWHKG